MTIPTWEEMRCVCGGTKFLRAIGLRWHPTGGTTETPGGWLCADCLKSVDMGEMLNRCKLALKKEELRTLTEEITGASPQGR